MHACMPVCLYACLCVCMPAFMPTHMALPTQLEVFESSSLPVVSEPLLLLP